MRGIIPSGMKLSNGRLIALLLGTLTLVGGCASSGRVYMGTLREHPNCVAEAGIARAKVDACMNRRNQADFNSCLADRKVPARKIGRLNACVDSHRRSTIASYL